MTTQTNVENYYRNSELKAFDDTKDGVKGLVDSGIDKIPRIFHSPPDEFDSQGNFKKPLIRIHVIDLDGTDEKGLRRREVVEKIKAASAASGFFQVINHGIPDGVMEEMLEGVRRFYEQDPEVKRKWYTRDGSKTVVYNSNFDLFRAASANWRDTAYCNMAPKLPNPDELPEACREILIDYSKRVMSLGRSLFELLSEALGLDSHCLNDLGCSEGLAVLYHCYPACPEPELTLGASRHADYGFLTILLQDHIGGLQVLFENQWVDVTPQPGALVVNGGDLLQLISNDNFRSSQHRVLANKVGPRVSVACFFTTGLVPLPKLYGPIKELISEENPVRYKETTVRDYSLHYNSKGLGDTSALSDFRV
ncbi:oxidoreductase [Lithospermum erythrorhizon]|uniref:Oxidoreductase n=1 Tax=Lithospermum erythrorhizon TaxID=34254 RepID=A0AAV3NLX4_LITER